MNSLANLKRAVIVAAILHGAVVGCDRRGPAGIAASGTQPLGFNARAAGKYTFALNAKDQWIAGIDYARVSFGEWHDGGTAYVVWTDLDTPGGSGGGDRWDGSAHGNHRSSDPPRRIEYRCALADRQDESSATMTIDGQEFRLSQGGLFLVSTTTGETIVRQLDRDLSPLGEGDHKDIYRNMIESDTEMQDFFKNPEGREE